MLQREVPPPISFLSSSAPTRAHILQEAIQDLRERESHNDFPHIQPV